MGKLQPPIVLAAIVMTLLGGVGRSRVHAGQQANPPSPASPSSAAGRSTPAAQAGNADAGRQAFVKKGFASFTNYVRAPRGQMPPYTAQVVSDSELVDMYAFLQARPRPVSIDALVPKDTK